MPPEYDSKNISSLILDALRAKGLSVERLSQLTGVSERFIVSFIEGKIEKLPSPPYARGYLIKIAEALNLDGEKLWREYLKNSEALPRSGEKDYLPKNRFAPPRFNKRLALIILILVIAFGYILIKLTSSLGRTELTFTNLDNNPTVVQDKTFKIVGKINPANNQLTLNGERLYPNKEGDFEKIIELQPGFNTLTFGVKKLLGKEFIINKQVFYEVPQAPPPPEEEPPTNQ